MLLPRARAARKLSRPASGSYSTSRRTDSGVSRSRRPSSTRLRAQRPKLRRAMESRSEAGRSGKAILRFVRAIRRCLPSTRQASAASRSTSQFASPRGTSAKNVMSARHAT